MVILLLHMMNTLDFLCSSERLSPSILLGELIVEVLNEVLASTGFCLNFYHVQFTHLAFPPNI